MIVTTIDKIKEIIPTIVSSDFNDYSTFIRDAERWIKNEYLGTAFYEDIDTNKAEEDYSDLVELVSIVIVLKSYDIAIPFLDLVQTESGFAVMSSQNKAPASKDRVKALRIGNLNRMADVIEDMLLYLDTNKPTFDKWPAAPGYTTRYTYLIYSARLFNELVRINGSHRFYLACIPLLNNVETFYLEPTISKDLLDEIKKQVKAGNISEANNVILPWLRIAEALYTISQAIEKLSVQIDQDGLKLLYQIGQTSVPDVNRNRHLSDRYKSEADGFLKKAQEYILNNLDDFETYTNSSAYDDQESGYQGYSNSDNEIFVGGA